MSKPPVEFSVYDAKTQLSRLLDRAAAGEEIIVTRHGRPVARIAPLRDDARPRKLGTYKGRIWMSPDFDDPLPEEIQAEFEAPL